MSDDASQAVTWTDQAAQADWWSDYAEHAAVLAAAGVLAVSRGPGWQILRSLCSSVWLYLGLVAILVLPDHTGSWGRMGGAIALLVGVGFGVAVWRGARSPALTQPVVASTPGPVAPDSSPV
jgi:hypothetical protein